MIHAFLSWNNVNNVINETHSVKIESTVFNLCNLHDVPFLNIKTYTSFTADICFSFKTNHTCVGIEPSVWRHNWAIRVALLQVCFRELCLYLVAMGHTLQVLFLHTQNNDSHQMFIHKRWYLFRFPLYEVASRCNLPQLPWLIHSDKTVLIAEVSKMSGTGLDARIH